MVGAEEPGGTGTTGVTEQVIVEGIVGAGLVRPHGHQQEG